MVNNVFEDGDCRHSPKNTVEAFCYQIYDRLKIARAMAEMNYVGGAFKQIDLIEKDIELLKEHRELGQLTITKERT
jgi:hypothetical protein